MDKDSKLLLCLYKIWICSPQFAYIYYTHFIIYKPKFKRVLWVGLQYVNEAFPGLTQLFFCNLLGSFTFILQFSDFYQWYITINMHPTS